ncbi:Cytochrome b561 [Candidatus Nitrotoga sp. HW29]|uniref:cytochrome b n=1 Tax=Candidatus Nitrotoga sp. HW29 TaxID=2886963 RepID=UPI001EF23AE9|nr:cytochrome b [Candidatus Nitrotoga sp. HW29]CAH1904189.1 Cytochrome b561 [Candidatus Nitrotoga sp. HW29]
MIVRNTTDRYGALTIGIYWLMLLMFVAVYACIELHEFFPKGSDLRATLKTWHFMLGLSIFVLASIRLIVYITSTTPRIEPDPPKWQKQFAKLFHLALYVLMIAMPLMGWLLLSAEGKPIPFFGLHLPALIDKSKYLADVIEEIHETGGTIGYFLIGLHAVAALYHHYLVRDNTLRRMLPKRN